MNLPEGCPKIAESDTARVIAQPDVQTILAGTTQENVLANAEAAIQKVKAGAPNASQADIINSLTIGYCPTVMGDKSLETSAQKSQALDGFALRVYTDLASKGQDTTSGQYR